MSKDEQKKGRKRAITILLVLLILLCLGGAGYLVYTNFLAPREDAGATVSKYEGMSRAEIQAELDRQARESRMTISVNAKPQLKDGKVRVNVINDKSNKFDQSFVLEQGGKTLYESGIVKRGKKVEWVDAAGAKAGKATLTVTARNRKTGKKSGNPQSVQVEIVKAE